MVMLQLKGGNRVCVALTLAPCTMGLVPVQVELVHSLEFEDFPATDRIVSNIAFCLVADSGRLLEHVSRPRRSRTSLM